MVKKIVSFIVILLAYTIIGGSVLIGTSNFGMGFGNNVNSGIKYAYALDRAGDIYYITDVNDEKMLVSIDSSGKKLFEKKLSSEVFGESFYVDSIYVEHDKKIYITVNEFDKSTSFINRVSVHMFCEDGSYSDEIFSSTANVYLDSGAGIISSFSEDDTHVFFSMLTDGKAEVFAAPKDNSEAAAKVQEYAIDGEVYGFCTTSEKSVAVGCKNGITIYSADGAKKYFSIEDAICDRFWNGISSFYALDSATGNIYSISHDLSMTDVVNGRKVINAEYGLTTADMSDIAIGITGNIFGTVRGEEEHLFSGSFSLMTEVYIDSVNKGALISSVLSIAAVCAGVILLTILSWDFFCSILKMRLSILLRQSLLIAMMIFLALYSLSFFIIIPQVESIVTTNYIHEAELIANSFEDGMNGVIYQSDAPTYSVYSDYLAHYGAQAALGNSDDEFDGNNEKPLIDILENRNGSLKIMASGELYPYGYPADMLIYDRSITDTAAEMTGTEQSLVSYTPYGEKLYLLRRIQIPVTQNETYMLVGIGINGLSSAVDHIQNMVNLFLVLGGIILIVVFMLIESITAGAVRRLRRSVDRIANGEYNAPVNIRTGDEVEDLSTSVKALAAHIIDKTTSLERLNNSYYRFVPQSFLANLGETQIEKVGKSLYAKKHMAVLFLRFDFSQPLSGMEAQDIFDSINSVYEHIMPIIDANAGTGYNFLFNGLSAIFPDSTESALQAAIKIRETISAFNEIQQSRNRRTAEVRIVISEGEVLLGFIGDDKRMEPTVVSTAINESEEIEKILSDSGLYIVCTEKAFNSLPKDKYRSRCIGSFVTVESGSGKLYDMFDSDPYMLIKLKEQHMTRFELGVNLFEKQDFVNARNMFMDIVKYAADDGVSRNYMYLSEHNLTSEKKQLTYMVYGDAVITPAAHNELNN